MKILQTFLLILLISFGSLNAQVFNDEPVEEKAPSSPVEEINSLEAIEEAAYSIFPESKIITNKLGHKNMVAADYDNDGISEIGLFTNDQGVVQLFILDRDENGEIQEIIRSKDLTTKLIMSDLGYPQIVSGTTRRLDGGSGLSSYMRFKYSCAPYEITLFIYYHPEMKAYCLLRSEYIINPTKENPAGQILAKNFITGEKKTMPLKGSRKNKVQTEKLEEEPLKFREMDYASLMEAITQ
jgi:hypothetical protein